MLLLFGLTPSWMGGSLHGSRAVGLLARMDYRGLVAFHGGTVMKHQELKSSGLPKRYLFRGSPAARRNADLGRGTFRETVERVWAADDARRQARGFRAIPRPALVINLDPQAPQSELWQVAMVDGMATLRPGFGVRGIAPTPINWSLRARAQRAAFLGLPVVVPEPVYPEPSNHPRNGDVVDVEYLCYAIRADREVGMLRPWNYEFYVKDGPDARDALNLHGACTTSGWWLVKFGWQRMRLDPLPPPWRQRQTQDPGRRAARAAAARERERAELAREFGVAP